MLYRTRNRLSRGGDKVIERGRLTTLDWLDEEQQQTLLDVGAVVPARYPPLGEVPGWNIRAGRLRNAGYPDVEAFLEADAADIAEALGYYETTVARWRAELRQWLEVDWPETA